MSDELGLSSEQRDDQVLAAMRILAPTPVTPAQIARLIDQIAPCVWCLVLPPLPGKQCAVVPTTSSDRIRRVLMRLVKRRLVVKYRMFRRSLWALTDSTHQRKSAIG